MTRQTIALVVVALIIQTISLVLFSFGFFPLKTHLPGFASFQSQYYPVPSSKSTLKQTLATFPKGNNADFGDPPSERLSGKFDRLFIMLVDALRSDFVYGPDSGFDFTQLLIKQGKALPFVALASAPTVTMPRLKAILTGSSPNFLDAVLNIAEADSDKETSFAFLHDNILSQFRRQKGSKIKFFGDDTWLRLFPNFFDKSEGTFSFFATDTVEVDLNVTRHVKEELEASDWDVMILHYLGLDHIGHSSGPTSVLMKPKQREMDDVFKNAYQILKEKDRKDNLKSLLLLLGDHGMNDLGNHGGSTPGELATAAVFASDSYHWKMPSTSSSRKYKEHPIINQIDLVPTISTLFSLPIPKNNLGKLITPLFIEESEDTILRALQLNAMQLFSLLTSVETIDRDSLFSDVTMDCKSSTNLRCLGNQLKIAWESHSKFLHSNGSYLDSENFYKEFLENCASYLFYRFSNYNLKFMITGVGLSVISLFLLYFSYNSNVEKKETSRQCKNGLLWILLISYSVSFFSSSFVEEEHQFWYFFMASTWVFQSYKRLSLFFKQSNLSVMYPIFQLLILRILRGWNQTGQKFAYLKDIKFFITQSYPNIGWATFFISLFFLSIRFAKSTSFKPKGVKGCIFNFVWAIYHLIQFLSICVYKLDIEASETSEWKEFAQAVFSILKLDEVILARGILLLLIPHIILLLFYYTDNNVYVFGNLLSIVLVLFSRHHNALLFILFHAQLTLLVSWVSSGTHQTISTNELSVILIAMYHVSFFSMGNSNSLASLDIGYAYFGLKEYVMLPVGILTFVCNWAGPIWWVWGGLSLFSKLRHSPLPDMKQKHWDTTSARFPEFKLLLILSSVFRGATVLVLSVSVLIFRNHLFIWSVFSPRYLYNLAWCFAFQLGVEIPVWFIGYYFFYL